MDTSHDGIYSIILAFRGILIEIHRILSIDFRNLPLVDGLQFDDCSATK